jgi:hypothetical protein
MGTDIPTNAQQNWIDMKVWDSEDFLGGNRSAYRQMQSNFENEDKKSTGSTPRRDMGDSL